MATLTASPPVDPVPSNICAVCAKPLSKKSVRALGSAYHYDCFKCLICKEPLSSLRFFPLKEDGNVFPVCERDYFKRLDLTCRTCGEALRDTYIVAANSKYHLNHFTCSQCDTHFGPDDLYYEHDGAVLCHYHYSTQYAIRCTGCAVIICKQYVEGNNNERWHAECYMINKFWNVRLSDYYGHERYAALGEDVETAKKMERDTEEKVYQIWTVLSAFEELSAATISEMLLHVSIGKHIEGVNMAKRFIDHVHILFKAINILNEMFSNVNEPGPHFKREARELSRKTVDFFALLSQTQESGLRRIGITQELLALITGLANNLKSLIRIGLKSALKLEQKHSVTDAISVYLKQLVESNQRPKHPQFDSSLSSSMDFKTDLCYRCNKTIEESCIKMKRYRWHEDCFACTRCDENLADNMDSAIFDLGSLTVFCNVCGDGNPEKALTCFEKVSLLEQYSFLLWVSLCRLDSLLRAPDGSITVSEHSLNQYKESSPVDLHSQSFHYGGRAKTITEGDKRMSISRESELKDMKSPQPQYKVFRSTSRSSRRANTFHASSQDAQSSTIPEETGEGLTLETPASRKSVSLVKRLSQRREKISIFGSPIETKFTKRSLSSTIKEKDLSNYIPQPEVQMGASGLKSKPSIRRVPSITADSCRLQTYLAELSHLQYMVAKHAAVLQLEPLVSDKFSLDELLDLIEQKRENMWNKLFTSFRANRRGIRNTTTFGVPIETLLERYGIDTKLGFGPGTLRLPSFFSQSIMRLKQLDMTVEGVFRKNGNIRVLQETADSIDAKPSGKQIVEEDNSIQLAALFKRFLRNLPDPLLTQKLYGLFIYSQSLDSEEDRRKALHLLCCILPQANRNCLEALSDLMQWVASFSAQNKMDLKNLATVITPNILYSKGSIPDRQEILTANHAVEMLLQHQEDFSLVPVEIEPAIHNSKITQFFEDGHNPTSRDFPKLYKRLTRKGTEFYATVPPAKRTHM